MTTDFPEVTTDVTVATDVNESLVSGLHGGGAPAGAAVRPEDDRTVFADPVEQAILVDRTRQPRRPAPGHAPLGGPAAEPRASSSMGIEPLADARAPGAPPHEVRPVGVAGGRARVGEGEGEEEGDGDGDSLVGQYRVVAPLATSGAPLLLAEHATMGFPVAIKMLSPALVGSAEAESRFFAEAAVAAHLAHPGIPMVLDYGHDQRGIAYLAREYLPGESLAALLAAGSTFSLEQVLEMGAQIADILAAAHARGVAHGDIRPDNIHVIADAAAARGLSIKVLEFGVADRTSPPSGGWYRAPEQGAGTGDPLADVYGLGCVLYQLLAGRPPFDATDEPRAAYERPDPPPPRVYRPDIPWPLDALVHRMVALHPQDRPSSSAEVERELRSFLGGDPAPGEASVAREAGGTGYSAADAWQSIRRGGSSLRASAAVYRRALVAAAREAAVHHPRTSVAIITAALFATTVGVVLLLR